MLYHHRHALSASVVKISVSCKSTNRLVEPLTVLVGGGVITVPWGPVAGRRPTRHTHAVRGPRGQAAEGEGRGHTHHLLLTRFLPCVTHRPVDDVVGDGTLGPWGWWRGPRHIQGVRHVRHCVTPHVCRRPRLCRLWL